MHEFQMLKVLYKSGTTTNCSLNIKPCCAVQHQNAGIILCKRPANKRRRYIVTSPLIGWAHMQNDPCKNVKAVCQTRTVKKQNTLLIKAWNKPTINNEQRRNEWLKKKIMRTENDNCQSFSIPIFNSLELFMCLTMGLIEPQTFIWQQE